MEKLRTGQFVPGQRLIEPELMSELKVGRNAVREALARLGSEGLIKLEPHRGASVVRLDEKELAEFVVVREALEGQAARLAAHRIEEGANRDRLEAAIQAVREALEVEDPVLYSDENSRFHATIIEIADNKRLSEFVGRLHFQLFRIQYLPDVAVLTHSHPEHEEIAQAILDGDGDGAERLMRRHIRSRAKEAFGIIGR